MPFCAVFVFVLNEPQHSPHSELDLCSAFVVCAPCRAHRFSLLAIQCAGTEQKNNTAGRWFSVLGFLARKDPYLRGWHTSTGRFHIARTDERATARNAFRANCVGASTKQHEKSAAGDAAAAAAWLFGGLCARTRRDGRAFAVVVHAVACLILLDPPSYSEWCHSQQ